MSPQLQTEWLGEQAVQVVPQYQQELKLALDNEEVETHPHEQVSNQTLH